MFDEYIGKHYYEQHEMEHMSPNDDKLISHLPSLPNLSMKDQFTALSSISNFHWCDNPSLKSNHTFQTKTTRISTHLVYPDEDRRLHLPTSPRNRLLFMLTREEYDMHISRLMQHYMNIENPQLDESVIQEGQDVPEPPPKRHRKQAARVIKVTANSFCERIGIDLNAVLNTAKKERPLYATFIENLLHHGEIKWRFHSAEKDICVMSDINPGNGILLPGSFVHVTCLKELDYPILKCTCEIYKLIKRSSKQKTPLWPVHSTEDEEDEVPDHTFTCMHCRFYRQYLINAYDTVQQGRVDLTPALKMVHESMQHMNMPIQLGNVLLHCTTKFSVKGDGSYSIVHFTFHQGKCYANCSDALCCAKLNSKKRIAKKISLKCTSQLCSHLSTVYDNFDFIKKFFPDYFNNNEDEGEEVQEEDD